MRVNISDIIKIDSAFLDIEFNDSIEGFESVADVKITSPVKFTGRLVNMSGVLKLDGRLAVEYTAKCCRCLKDINKDLNITVKEDFLNAEKEANTENYTYEGNFILLDKVLKDNIILNLPMRQVCNEECKGLCPICGSNLNEESCECREDTINPKMEALKNFFNN